MPQSINCNEFLNLQQKRIPVIDVRTPAEFYDGHIPGAINIPLFSNDERDIVGRKYKQENKEAAILQGLDYVGPKLSGFIKSLRKVAPKKEALLYCWRGGQRSKSMGWLFQMAGYKIKLLEGGYKAFRNFLLHEFSQDFHILILGGMTGSGKSEILTILKKLGQQVVDLETLANHRGSAFGAIGQNNQPTPQQFENDLLFIWRTLNPNQSVWLEDESASIGRVSIPRPLFLQMRNSPVIFIDVNKEVRIKRLVHEYTGIDSNELLAAVRKIDKRLGPVSTKNCIETIISGNFDEAASTILNYYDKAYKKGLSKRNPENVFTLPVHELSPEDTALRLIDFVRINRL